MENELPVLAQRAEKVRIFPMHRVPDRRSLPDNVEVTELFTDPYLHAGAAQLLRYGGAATTLLRSLWHDCQGKLPPKALRGELRSRIRQLIARTAVMERELLPAYIPGHTLAYSYWTHDWATLLALLRARHPRIAFLSRAHGFDLYEHQHASGLIPFRQAQLQQVNELHCVSQAGLDHMRTQHPAYAAKYKLSRLGTRDHGRTPGTASGPLSIVSCSYVHPRKRVHLIAEAVRNSSVPVRWTHFGDGPDMDAIRAIVADLPAHVEVDLKGAMQNARIMAWYKENPVDAFLLASSLEGGVAVALQEAASFGIPLIATDSGGVRDIMRPSTGILLPNDATPAAFTALIDGLREQAMSTPAFRDGVRRVWEEDFSATTNFNAFYDQLEALLAPPR